MENEISCFEHAKMYIDCLANGIDPVLNMPANADTLRNEQVIACFEYISDILERDICNIKDDMKKNNDFFITDEQIAELNIRQNDLKVSEISNEINRVTEVNKTKKMSAVWINNWLEAEGYLCKSDLNSRISNEKGKQIGITTERRKAKDGNEYYINLYSPQTQKFSICREIFRILEEKNCTFSIAVCQGKGSKLNNFVQSLE